MIGMEIRLNIRQLSLPIILTMQPKLTKGGGIIARGKLDNCDPEAPVYLRFIRAYHKIAPTTPLWVLIQDY